LTENAAYVGFGLKVYDQMTGASNQNGIYELGIEVDDMSQYSFELNSIPFSLTRYLNAHIDYAARRYSGAFFHRCFKLPGNALEIYEEDHEKGIIQIYENVPRKVEITASDFRNNTATLTFHIRRGIPVDTAIPRTYDYAIDYLQSAQINTPEFMVSFEPHTFYQNVKLNYIKSENVLRGCYTPAHELIPDALPVHRYYDLTLHAGSLPVHLQDKAFVARIEDNDQIVNCGGTIIGDFVYSRVRSLGSFSVSVDTIPPDVIPITFRENMKASTKMLFRIGDNQATEGQARGLSFDARVDNKWILMEYDAKSSKLTHTFDDRIAEGPHELVLKVTDDRGNTTTFKRNFTR
jgi:hypothetical protein